MNLSLSIALLALAPVGLALVFLYKVLLSRHNSQTSVDQCLVLSLEKYRPMERLLREEDFRFLSAQPGFSAQLGRRFRAQRRQVFRGYLRSLRKDFGSLFRACQMLMVHAAEDRGDLAKILVRQRLMFAMGMLAVEGRLLLHVAGIGAVDVRELVGCLEAMQTQIRLTLAPLQTATALA